MGRSIRYDPEILSSDHQNGTRARRAGLTEGLEQPLDHGPDGRRAATARSMIPPPVVIPQRLVLQAHHERVVSAGRG
jgi:hypothetical protein